MTVESKYEYCPRHNLVYENACWLCVKEEDSDRNEYE
jgi:hypothetical protein